MENPNENQSDVESPLEGLIDKPMHEMSDEERREFVMKMQGLRDSSQARSAFFRGTYEKKEKTTAFDEF